MSDFAIFECQIGTTDPACPLGITVLIDGEIAYVNHHVNETVNLQKSIPDEDGEHKIEFVLSGKLPEHTKVDESGNIIQDAMLTIKNVKLDSIDIDQLVTEQAVYTHDFNGGGKTTEDKFYGNLGCNGTAKLVFTSPVYLWMLENM